MNKITVTVKLYSIFRMEYIKSGKKYDLKNGIKVTSEEILTVRRIFDIFGLDTRFFGFYARQGVYNEDVDIPLDDGDEIQIFTVPPMGG
jgi:molybdopterin converting factor small subunit